MEKKTILGEVYKAYKKEVNMSLKELREWSKNPLSRKASLNRRPINMAIRLNAKPLSRWGLFEIKFALRNAIPYLKRAKKIRGDRRVKGRYTKNQIAMKNWGFDIKKVRRRL